MMTKQRALPQEALKIIACVAMLLDHTGMVIVPYLPVPYMETLYYILRGIGRIAFPLYAFLLVEGMRYTRNPQKYILRLGLGILLAEIPFDLALSGEWNWEYQNVMVTLTLGAVMLRCMQKTEKRWIKALLILPFGCLADLTKCDYSGWGILMIGVFALIDKLPVQALCILLINWLIPSLDIPVFGIQMSIQLVAIFAMVPIALYSGRKLTGSRTLQWGFYLYYPVHLLILWLILPFVM